MKHIVTVLSLILLLSFLPASAFAEDKAFKRIQEKREINCGVYVLGSIFSYDKDGNPQGFTVDLFKEVSERTGLKVKYKEISSFATLFEDLNVGHYDMVCSPILALPSTIMNGLFGTFISYDPINIYASSEMDISDITNLKQLNDSKYTFVGMDGELGGIYAPKKFPKAKLNLLPLGMTPANMFLEIDGKKADFIVLSSIAEKAYSKENPGKLQQVTDKSLVPSTVRLFFPEDSLKLQSNMDVVIDDIKRDGSLDKLLLKHGLNN